MSSEFARLTTRLIDPCAHPNAPMSVVTISASQFQVAERLATETLELFAGRRGFYRNDWNSHLRGKVGEIAAAQALKELGLLVEPLFEDLSRLNDADIECPSAFRADVKTWSNQFWGDMGRCVAVGQLPALTNKADLVIWCVAERDLRVDMGVTVVGWNTLSDIRDAPRRWTGPATGRKVDNFQVDESAVRGLPSLLEFRRDARGVSL